MIKTSFSLYLGKLTRFICHCLPFIGGSALPGLIALKLDPQFIQKMVAKNQLQSIIITGTNGKTTTSRLLGTILKHHSTPYIHNRTGSNLLRGIASTLIKNSSLTGRLSAKLAVWEIDEAVTPEAIKQLKPQLLLFTNLFRDQLDRYGEIDTILNQWLTGLKSLPKNSKLIVNLDDPSLNYLASQHQQSQSIISYGLSASLSRKKSLAHAADAIFCPLCLSPLEFTHVFTSHLGHYHCSNCSFKRQKPRFTLNSKPDYFQLPGLHHLYNLLAATTIAKTLKIDQKTIIQALKAFQPAFGRNESFTINQKQVNILLVKNPAGFNATLETLSHQKELLSKPLLFILNDLIADGTDVSWIWDVDFEILKNRHQPVVVSGLRAYDLALRLKYAGLNQKLIIIKPAVDKAFSYFKQLNSTSGSILSTYTAMLKLRKILSQQKLIHSTWKD